MVLKHPLMLQLLFSTEDKILVRIYNVVVRQEEGWSESMNKWSTVPELNSREMLC